MKAVVLRQVKLMHCGWRPCAQKTLRPVAKPALCMLHAVCTAAIARLCIS
jgi:hypothetical protein